MPRADVLEHADRDDAIVAVLDRAVVREVELHPVGDPGGLGPGVRHPVLLARQGHAVDLKLGMAVGQEQAEAAPSRADVENLVAGLGPQLGGEVDLLVVLRGLEVVGRVEEVAAAVLPVAVQEQVEQLVAQIVVVRDLALRGADRVPVPEGGAGIAEPPQHALDALGLGAAEIQHADLEEGVEVGAVLHHQPTVHVAFADRDLRREEQPVVQRPVGQPDGRVGTGRAFEVVATAVRVDDGQMAFPDELSKSQGRKHRSYPLNRANGWVGGG